MGPPDRETDWRRKLRRLRFGAEPLEVQIDRYRRATWALTAVMAGVAGIFLGLFSAFGRPDVGAVLVAVVFGPAVLVAWLDFALLSRRTWAYLREHSETAGKAKSP